jgi:2',3'-cyclic-nucleotide 2'-phosphodiesterase (5'-nucleotidase family)
VEGLVFRDYVPVIRSEARILIEQGAQLLIVMMHDGMPAMKKAAQATADLPIRVFLGGHTHKSELEVLTRHTRTSADDVILLNAHSKGRTYGRIELTWGNGKLIAHTEKLVPVGGKLKAGTYPGDPAIKEISRKAGEKVGPVLSKVVGRTRQDIRVGVPLSSPLGELVADSWVEFVPNAELAITNFGGIRQSLDAGLITAGDVLGVLPFNNQLLIVRLTPEQIREVLENPLFICGGIKFRYRMHKGKRIITGLMDQEGRPLMEGRKYSVVTTDFLYAGGDGARFAIMDPHPTWIGIGWREPFLEFLSAHHDNGVLLP